MRPVAEAVQETTQELERFRAGIARLRKEIDVLKQERDAADGALSLIVGELRAQRAAAENSQALIAQQQARVFDALFDRVFGGDEELMGRVARSKVKTKAKLWPFSFTREEATSDPE